MTEFGRIVGRAEVTAAIVEFGQLWLPTYLAEVSDQMGYADTIPNPRSWTVSPYPQAEWWPEDQTTRVHVGCAGTDALEKDGEGNIGGVFVVNVWVFAAARDEASTARLGDAYTRAIRALFVQHRSIGGFARTLEWIGETYGLDDPDERRTTALGQNTFAVQVDQLVSARQGPVDPVPPGEEGWPYEITETEAVVTRRT